ncbi:hypothetical protein ATO6_17230 [Oceanicola sp. 22II-s10i]|uniref:DUF2059 domain-containing protein n=1 Tax=Oceanicola sp. 22II-s10i TaxID=1317116 RepID=UPI000B5243CD|nr:DUF2059 domain-containing protein [Oceanicola sp. 22II-s10i]OWU83612.1 hypothetical protein ATO6_17230 [Oceanicola sp. 22II-s10i]
MRHLRPAFAALPLILTLLFSATLAQAADRDRVRAFLTVTGFDVALESIKLTAEDAPAMLGVNARDFGASWTRLASEVFDVAKMQEMGVDILQNALSDEALAEAADFYASDLGQRLVEAENRSHMEARDDRQGEGEALMAEMMQSDPERVAIIDRMMRAIGSTESSLDAANEVQIRFLMAAAAAGIVTLKTDEEGMRAIQAEQREEALEMIRQSGMRGSAYTYRDFSNADLEAYAVALEAPLMQEVYELMNAVQFEIMANRYEALAHRMNGLDPGQEL